MSVLEVASDASPTALTLAAPVTLTTQTTPGVYQLVVDGNNLVGTDILIVRTKIKIVSGGTSRLLFEEVVPAGSIEKIWSTEPMSIAWEVVYEIEQVAGTGRVIPWSALRS